MNNFCAVLVDLQCCGLALHPTLKKSSAARTMWFSCAVRLFFWPMSLFVYRSNIHRVSCVGCGGTPLPFFEQLFDAANGS